MRITRVTPLVLGAGWRELLFVKVETDEGITGGVIESGGNLQSWAGVYPRLFSTTTCKVTVVDASESAALKPVGRQQNRGMPPLMITPARRRIYTCLVPASLRAFERSWIVCMATRFGGLSGGPRGSVMI